MQKPRTDWYGAYFFTLRPSACQQNNLSFVRDFAQQLHAARHALVIIIDERIIQNQRNALIRLVQQPVSYTHLTLPTTRVV